MIEAVSVAVEEDAQRCQQVFERIAANIVEQGYSVVPNALPEQLGASLLQHVLTMPQTQFDSAGVGRESDHTLNRFVRTDAICWINGESSASQQWLAWATDLQQYLNRRLFLGLFSFESHFAHYRPGDYYKKHMDAFKGETNQVLSLVYYLNTDWGLNDGGELKIYLDGNAQGIEKEQGIEKDSLKVTPVFGTLVVFLSEDFAHEVLPANRDRYSIAGWFRVNTSTATKVDPPT